jgi:hypothetical protein
MARWHAVVPADGKRLVGGTNRFPSNRTARVLICVYSGALHGFIKKTRTTPEDDLTLARKRQKELEQ